MRFDIILPTMGRGSLVRAIESVIAQTHQDWRLQIVGDGPIFVPAFPFDERIKPIVGTRESQGGFGGPARNFGITMTDSPWIAYIDDDDEWFPHHLASHARMIEDHPDVGAFRTAGQSFKMGHKSPRTSKLVRKLGPINTQDPMTVGITHTRKLFLRTPGWRSEDNHDHILWHDLISTGGPGVVSPEVTFLFQR